MSRTIVVAGCMLLLSAAAQADPLSGKHPLLSKRISIGVGGFFPQIDSRIRLDSQRLGLGTTLDFEDELQLDETKETAWAAARWRITKRHNLELEWSSLDRSATVAAISDPYQVGDTVIQAGGRIDTTFDLEIYRLTYGFSPLRRDDHELQLQAGVHVARLQTLLVLSGTLSVNGQSFTAATSSEGSDLTAPLPHLGANFTYAISEKLAFYGNVLGFALEVDDVDGSIIETGGTLQWNFTPNFGIGGGLRFFRVRVESGDEDLRGEFKYDYIGPVVYVSAAF